MRTTTVSREVTVLNEKTDTILIFDRKKTDFSYPLHFHPEYELNFLSGAQKAERIIGDNIGQIGELELCLVGPNLYHIWKLGEADPASEKREITLQFLPNVFPDTLLAKDIYKAIAGLLARSKNGVLFTEQTALQALPMLENISRTAGFEAYMHFLRLMEFLAEEPGQTTLASNGFQNGATTALKDNRIEKIHDYIIDHYKEKITLGDAANVLSMSPVSVTRLIKQRTGKSFVDFLNEIRIGFATRMIVDSDMSISEICFASGFNNISNFNRTFRRRQGLTPTEFKMKYLGKKKIM